MNIEPGSIIYNTNPPVKIVGEMTLRDYFAAKAMQADLHPGLYHMITHEAENKYDAIAAVAYFQADAMLRARKRYATQS